MITANGWTANIGKIQIKNFNDMKKIFLFILLLPFVLKAQSPILDGESGASVRTKLNTVIDKYMKKDQDIIDNLLSTSPYKALSAKQGKILNEKKTLTLIGLNPTTYNFVTEDFYRGQWVTLDLSSIVPQGTTFIIVKMYVSFSTAGFCFLKKPNDNNMASSILACYSSSGCTISDEFTVGISNNRNVQVFVDQNMITCELVIMKYYINL